MIGDPTGAAICVRETLGAELVNEPGTWMMSSLHTTDTEHAGAFYRAVFGWVAEPLGPFSILRLDGYTGGEQGQTLPRDVVAVMAPPAPAEQVPPHWNVNFRVADTDAIAEHAASLGGRALLPPFDAPGFRNAVIADPNGAVFSISQVLV